MGLAEAFSKVAKSKATVGSDDLRAGVYLVTVKAFTAGEKRKGFTFIPEFLVEESSPSVDGISPNAAGSTFSCKWNITTIEAAAGNVKNFVLAAAGGVKEESMTEQQYIDTLTAMTGSGQPLRGLQLRIRTRQHRVKDGKMAGKDITIPQFEYVDQTIDQIKARRAQMDGVAK